MKQKLNQERLSALLDNELTEFELRQVLRDSSDDELQVLSRWQLAQDALASKPAAIAPEGFAVQVQAAIGQIPQRGKPQWWSGIAKTMVAASVAAATVTVGWQFWQVEEASVAPATMASSSGQSYLDQGAARAELVAQPMLPQEKARVGNDGTTVKFISPMLRQVQGLQTERAEAMGSSQHPHIHFIGKDPAQ